MNYATAKVIFDGYGERTFFRIAFSLLVKIKSIGCALKKSETDEYLRGTVENNAPVIVIGRDFRHESVDDVSADRLRGGFEATRYPVDSGHERIGFNGAISDGGARLKKLRGHCKRPQTT